VYFRVFKEEVGYSFLKKYIGKVPPKPHTNFHAK